MRACVGTVGAFDWNYVDQVSTRFCFNRFEVSHAKKKCLDDAAVIKVASEWLGLAAPARGFIF